MQDNPSLAELQVGDLVETAGGSESLAPPGIPVGRVANRADRPGSGGPLLDVELNADLTRLNFVRVVIYKPLSEVERVVAPCWRRSSKVRSSGSSPSA